jgi:hypothetical protein
VGIATNLDCVKKAINLKHSMKKGKAVGHPLVKGLQWRICQRREMCGWQA